MPIFDGENLIITLDSGVTEVDVIGGIYEPWKDWMLASARNRKYPQAFTSDGGNPLSSIINQGSYIFLQNLTGWRLKAPEEDITIYLTGNLAVQDTTLSAFIPTTGAFTAAIIGLQPVTQGVTEDMASQLAFSTYQGGVAIKPSSPYTIDSTVPGVIGSREYPVNNIQDAHTISDNNGLRDFFVMESITIVGVDLSDGIHRFVGDNENYQITVDPSSDLTGCALSNLIVVGELDGFNSLRECSIGTVTNVSGKIRSCTFFGDITLNGDTEIIASYSNKAGASYVNVNTGGINILEVSDWHRSIGIQGMTGGTHTIEMYGGQLHLDASCTGGTVYLRGNYSQPPDDQGTGTVIIDQTEHKAIWGFSINGALKGSYGEALRRASFNGAIHLDSINGTPGITYPAGTESNPITTIADALIIGAAENIYNIKIIEDVTVQATDNIDGYSLKGSHATKSEITLVSGCSTNITNFVDCQLTGIANGQIIIRDSFVNQLSGFGGVLFNCALSGEITPANLPGIQNTLILHCYANAAIPAQTVILNYINNPDNIVVHKWSGPLTCQNKTTAISTSITYDMADITLDASCTGGTFYIGGMGGIFTNNSTSAVNNLSVFTAEQLTEMWQLFGLDKDNAMTVTPTSRIVANINQTISGDGNTTSTVLRN